MADALLEAIAADPADDGPRLVWADREGGERGELVVLQCALARHDLEREERRRFAVREKELLARNVSSWAGLARATFRRGFVERVQIDLAELAPQLETLFARFPTLSDLQIDALSEPTNRFVGPTPDEAWAAASGGLRDVFDRLPPGRVTALALSAGVTELGDWSDPGSTISYGAELLALLASAASLGRLRALALADAVIASEHVPALAKLRLEALHLRSHRLGGAGVAALLRGCPSITRLGVWYGRPRLTGAELTLLLEASELSRLSELDLMLNDLTAADLAAIGTSWSLRHLERLGLGFAKVDPDALRAIARAPHLSKLRELDLYGIKSALAALDDPTFADSLRVLRLPTTTTDLDMFPHLTALERVEAGG